MALHVALREQNIDGIIETVPSFRSLMIHYDPLQVSQLSLKALIGDVLTKATAIEGSGACVQLPVCYDLGDDLATVAATTGLSQDDVVQLHSGTKHYVYMLGFAPGHPYLGDLPKALALPRRRDPRPEVPAGAVTIAVGLTVIYPFDNPCGWHLIGRTPLKMFDPSRSPPTLVTAGDTIECRPVSLQEFERIEAEVSAGRYRVKREGAS